MTYRKLTAPAVAAAIATVLLAGTAMAQQAATYTDVQATQGASAFGANCARCHGDKAQGAEGPALVGGQFDASWRGQPVSALIEFIQTTMPADKPGTVNKDSVPVIVAHILKLNNVPAGATPLSPTMVIPK